LVLNLSLAKKAVPRHGTGYFCRDRAFSLIEGHPALQVTGVRPSGRPKRRFLHSFLSLGFPRFPAADVGDPPGLSPTLVKHVLVLRRPGGFFFAEVEGIQHG
jgi:hypothetical protein